MTTTAQFTQQDLIHAGTYATERFKLDLVQEIHQKFPHISLYLNVAVQRADSAKHYYYNPSFRDRALVVRIHMDQGLCEKLSCSRRRWHADCTPSDKPVAERMGDTTLFEVRCQPACFNLRKDKTPALDDNGKPMPQAPFLLWNASRNKCQFASGIDLWMRYPQTRSKVDKMRVTDLPVGFNTVPDSTTVSGVRGHVSRQPIGTGHRRRRDDIPHVAHLPALLCDAPQRVLVGHQRVETDVATQFGHVPPATAGVALHITLGRRM